MTAEKKLKRLYELQDKNESDSEMVEVPAVTIDLIVDLVERLKTYKVIICP